MSICWINDYLGTGPFLQVEPADDRQILDVRDLVDKPGNRADSVRRKIEQGCEILASGSRLVVCCDYGISRSNAIAAGILACHEDLPFSEAVRRVHEATGGKEFKLPPLQVVRRALSAMRGPDAATRGERRRILLTGGTGAIGQVLCQRLGASCEVIAPSRQEADLSAGTTRLGLLADEGADCLVHLASPRIYTSNIAMGDTLTMLRNVLDVCIECEVPLVFLSTWEVYSGYRASLLRADEALPLLPKGPYAETKYLCEQLIRHSRQHQGLRCTLLRPAPVYGPTSDKPKFIYNFIGKLRQGSTITTHRYRNTLPALDLLYIDDVIDALVRIVEQPVCGDFNLGTGTITSTLHIAERLRDFLGGTSDIRTVDIDADTACVAMDASKARGTFGWQPTVDINQGLQRLLDSL